MNQIQNALKVFEEEIVEVASEILTLQQEANRIVASYKEDVGGEISNAMLMASDLFLDTQKALTAEWNDLLGTLVYLKECGVKICESGMTLGDRAIAATQYRSYSQKIVVAAGLGDVVIKLLKLENEVSKAIRFGIDEQRDLPTSNRERIELGWQGIERCLMKVAEAGINFVPDQQAITRKVNKIKKYTQYSQEIGAVN